MPNLNSKQAGILNTNPVNEPSSRVYKGKNQFPQSFVHPSTCSYGLVDPVAFAKCEPGDVYPYKFVTDLNTFTMQSPLKSKVTKYTAAFKVPMSCIYPRNWDIMFPITNKGDDVPDDTRSILDLKKLVQNLVSTYQDTHDLTDPVVCTRIPFILESIFSDGGIFAKCNLHFCNFLCSHQEGQPPKCFDDWFDLNFIPALKEYFQYLASKNGVHLTHYGKADEGQPKYIVTFDPNTYGHKSPNIRNTYYISFDRAVELLRSGEYLITDDGEYTGEFPNLIIYSVSVLPRINIEYILSYQLACSHFFNNPKVDFIYSADLYIDNMQSLQVLSGYDPSFFDYNGVQHMYDVFSSNRINSDSLTTFDRVDSDRFFYQTAFWINLFNFQRSLRYGDYFTGAHPEPIAPGDITAPVTAQGVNALDMTRKIQLTRLLNKVNINGPRIEDYLKGIFGVVPPTPDNVPIRLSLESSDVSGFEVNNTGSDQLSDDSPNITTTNLRLEDSKYMFEVSIDKPCYIVVVQYFDAHRIYSKTIDRFAFHYDRFDDFIPDLQFDGDQDVKMLELDSLAGLNDNNVFGYNLRYMEYKQRYSYASGGFIRRLPSWAMVTDNRDGAPAHGNINPDFIRSVPTEFDRFYKKLSGYSLGTRFHFITFNTNVAAPYRQMVYAPEILA